jgi:Sec-independent protein translocase protein TatA
MNKTLLTLLLGVGIGILGAPGKGSETWKKLLASIDEYKDKLSDQVNNLVDEGKSDLNKAKSKVQNEVNEFEGSTRFS